MNFLFPKGVMDGEKPYLFDGEKNNRKAKLTLGARQ